MMNLLLPALTIVLSLAPGRPEKPVSAPSELATRVSGYLDQALPGVFYSDAADVRGGRIVRLFAVGTAPIRTSLGVEDGLEMAREKAQLSAREELVRFLSSRVTVRITSRDEIVITKESGGDGPTEAGRKIERRTKETEETASAVVRGLRVVGARQASGEKTYVVVYRWDAVAADVATPGQQNEKTPVTVKPIPEKRIIVDR